MIKQCTDNRIISLAMPPKPSLVVVIKKIIKSSIITTNINTCNTFLRANTKFNGYEFHDIILRQ